MAEPTRHPFDEALELTQAADGLLHGRTTPAYANMVGPFGGVTAATLLRAVEHHPERQGEPLALTVNFVAPVTEGDFAVAVRCVRTNRTNQHWIVEMIQDEVTVATATAVTGRRRDTWSDTEIQAPTAPPIETVPVTGIPEFIAWAKNYEFRFAEGAVPVEGAGEVPGSTTTLWVRDRPARALDYASLAAICDVFYPRVFLRRGRMMAAGTITLTTYFHAEAHQLDAAGDNYLLATARGNKFHDGYFDQSGEIWTPAGELLATTHQLVYFKD